MLLPKKLFPIVNTLHIMIAVCGLHLYAQSQDPRIPLRAAARAAAAKAAAQHAANIAQVLTPPPPTAVGTFVTFDVPGAVNGTFPSAINDSGDTAGPYFDNVGSGFHGFVRAANGTFVTFDIPGGIFSFPFGQWALNASGEVAGNYDDANFVQHSFVRQPNGTLTTFDPPGAVNGSFPSTISPDGVIFGVSYDSNFNALGFMRDSSGIFTEITGPGGLNGQFYGLALFGAALSSNPEGEIAGTYFEPAENFFGGNFRVFLLSKSGQYTTFDAANYPPCCLFSVPSGINPNGTVTGTLNDGFDIYRGFLRTPDGAVNVFDAPGAGTGEFQGTMTIGITPGGVVAGVYVGPNDGNFLGIPKSHGFVFLPQ